MSSVAFPARYGDDPIRAFSPFSLKRPPKPPLGAIIVITRPPLTTAARYERSPRHGSSMQENPANAGFLGCRSDALEHSRPVFDHGFTAGGDLHDHFVVTRLPKASHPVSQFWRGTADGHRA